MKRMKRMNRMNRMNRKWCQRLQLRAHLPHAPGVRMTVVNKLPQNIVSVGYRRTSRHMLGLHCGDLLHCVKHRYPGNGPKMVLDDFSVDFSRWSRNGRKMVRKWSQGNRLHYAMVKKCSKNGPRETSDHFGSIFRPFPDHFPSNREPKGGGRRPPLYFSLEILKK